MKTTTKATVIKDIRLFCIDCSGGNKSEVKECPLVRCNLWPYRMGVDPNPSKPRGIAKAASAGPVSDDKGKIDASLENPDAKGL